MNYLKTREHYEERYDNLTVELCRAKEQMLRDVIRKSKEEGLPKLTGKDSDKDPEHEMMKVMNVFHYSMVDSLAGERWQNRDESINDMMAEDEAKDSQLHNARLKDEPICLHCKKIGLRISDKHLSHQNENAKWDDPEQVLITLECTHCKKHSAVWEDGAVFEPRKHQCPKCRTTMAEKTTRRHDVIIDTYTCPGCNYSYEEQLDLSRNKTETNWSEPDSYWEEDKARFVLSDEAGREYLESKRNLEHLKQVMDKIQEKKDNKALYDAVAAIKKVNIGQLVEILQPYLEKAGYTDLSLDKPEISKDVYVGFNCLDSKTGRGEYDSRNILRKTVIKALSNTNWRLMTNGISYRLGYLNGRIRAYEREEDLINMVKKNPKLMAQTQAKAGVTTKNNERTMTDNEGREIIL